MGVYVDDMSAAYRGMIMCHMIADTHSELVEMADKIGVQRKWIQKEGTNQEHFDIALSKRRIAVAFGAQQITIRQLAIMLRDRKNACSPSYR